MERDQNNPPRFDFYGRRVAVTGAGGGLGSALVARLIQRGAIVTPISRDSSWDPSNYEILFLNAGFGAVQSVARPLMDCMREMFQVNVMEVINQAQQGLSSGALHVHVVGSVQCIVSAPHLALYSATKYAVRGWAYGSARELPGRVSISYPNGMRSKFFLSLKGDPKLISVYAEQVRAAQFEYDDPQDVAVGILEGISWGAREIIPTPFALKWFKKNGEDIRRMWYPELQQPSMERFDWWEEVFTYFRSVAFTHV